MTVGDAVTRPLVDGIALDRTGTCRLNGRRAACIPDNVSNRPHGASYMELNSILQAPNSRQPELISNYVERMSWVTRLREAFAETGWTKARLAREASITYDLVNKYLAGEVKQPRGDAIAKLAKALDLDPLFLEKGIDAETGETDVPIMGFVGAGAEVEPDFEQVPPEGLDHVTVPFPLPDDMIALQVRGDSMLPQFRDGAVLIVFREQRRPVESFYGEEAAVRTVDGRRFIKTIMRGPQDGVTLTSWNAAPIENVHLDWIGEIFTVFPGSALRRVSRQGGIQGQLRLRAS